MSERPTVDVAAIIEGQGLTPFLVRLVVLFWIVTFVAGFDMNAISFAAPVIRSTLDLSQAMMGKVFSFGLIGTMIGG